MRIAFIFNWHLMRQRPHHWVIQASQRGHEAHVYTPGRWPWRRLTVPYEHATRVICEPLHVAERFLCRLVGPASPWAQRLRAQAAARSVRLWESLWNGQTQENYDAVVFCGAVPDRVGRKSGRTILIYDCVDRWDGFPDAHPRAREFEASLVKSADMVWAVTPELARRLSEGSGAGKTHVIPNACDYRHFSGAIAPRRPRSWTAGTPVLGYAGHVGAWFDWEAVLQIARRLPQAVLWIIGPHTGRIPRAVPRNIVCEGFVPYERLPEYYAGFDVGIIPFQGDLLLPGVSPIKLYEYLAAGKPVVSSPLADAVACAGPGIVEVATNPGDFPRLCRRLLSVAHDETLVKARQRLACRHSWEERWALCESLICKALVPEVRGGRKAVCPST
ncbi:MAG: glycosyltransferase [Planctomycetes bacterium]|nr:glycosyltransferase [Planctomycetota bacterium]